MSAPTRFTSGITQAAKWQALGQLGIPDPFFYYTMADDFLPYNSNLYTVSGTGATVAQELAITNVGGRVLLTTGTTAASAAAIQQNATAFQYQPGKKLAFYTRIRSTNVNGNSIVAGLIASGAPLPVTGIQNGIFFDVPAGSTTVNFTVRAGGVNIGSLTFSEAMVNDTDVDLSFTIDGKGNFLIGLGSNLTGSQNQNRAVLMPTNRLQASALTSPLPIMVLAPTVGLTNGAQTAAGLLSCDFLFAAGER